LQNYIAKPGGHGKYPEFVQRLQNCLGNLSGFPARCDANPAAITAAGDYSAVRHRVNFSIIVSFAMLTNIAIDRTDDLWVANIFIGSGG
jgi:hypothetical protein